MLAATPQALGPLLSAGSGQSLARQPDVVRLVGKDAKTLALVYVDTRGIAETVLPKLPELLRGFGPGMPSLDTSRLPSSKAFLPHLQPSVFSVGRTADGVELLSRQTLPGGNVGAAVPVAAAMVIPAVVSRQAVGALRARHESTQADRAGPAQLCPDATGSFPPAIARMRRASRC